MSVESVEDELLQKLITAFNPFTKNASEVREVRSGLARHVDRLVEFQREDGSSLKGKKPATELTGIRYRYLKSLQAHETALRRYRDLQAQNKPTESTNQGVTQHLGRASTADHLQLFRLRILHEELEILQHYATELERSADGTQILDLSAHMPSRIDSATDMNELNNQKLKKLMETASWLNENLERAVLQAKHQLDRGRVLLEEAKEMNELNSKSIDPASRLHALSKTRDELVKWIENKLGQPNVEPELLIKILRVPTSSDRSTNLSAAYESYLQARRRLLDVACATVEPDLHTTKEASASARVKKEESEQQVSIVLPYIEQQLLRVVEEQRSSISQSNHLSNQIKLEYTKTLAKLERLSNESHILSEYTSDTGTDRSSKVPPQMSTVPASNIQFEDEDHIRNWVTAWSSAAENAGQISADSIRLQAEQGVKFSTSAREHLNDLERILKQRELFFASQLRKENENST